MNSGPTEMPGPQGAQGVRSNQRVPPPPPPLPLRPRGAAARLDERARQDREIVYFLNPPETHSFFLYHDYTESRPRHRQVPERRAQGVEGHEPERPHPGHRREPRVETLRGEAITKAGLDLRGELEGAGAARHRGGGHPLPARRPRAARCACASPRPTPTPPAIGWKATVLVFDRSLGRPRNAIVLPAGYSLTTSSIPATVSETPTAESASTSSTPGPTRSTFS